MILKGIFDRVISFLGLLFLLPFLLVIAVLVKWMMPSGPVLFVQERVGKDGRLFKVHKFRTMSVKHDGSPISIAGEKRITPLGGVLRRYKLDELPELWDVLVGNMSFVGPCPDVPGYADQLSGEARSVILSMRPGITGPASLKYRDEEEMIASYVENAKAEGDSRTEQEIALWYNDNVIYPDKVRINSVYRKNLSFWMDIKIIIATVLGRRIDFYGEMV